MSDAEQTAAPVRVRMHFEEIKRLYPNEHVILDEIDDDPDAEFRLPDDISGVVIGHGKTRAEALAMARPFLVPIFRIAFRYTGKSRAPFPRYMPWNASNTTPKNH